MESAVLVPLRDLGAPEQCAERLGRGQKRKIFGGLSALEGEAAGWGEDFDIRQVGAACALGYLDFRFAQWEWRSRHPRLAAWFKRVSERPSVSATAPS